jgi:hypothetical protein
MTHAEASFESLATQDQLRSFYDSTRDRIALEGFEPGGPNMFAMEPGPRGLFLRHGDGTEFEARKCSDWTGQQQPLEVTEERYEGDPGLYYLVELETKTGWLTGSVIQGDSDPKDTSRVFPITKVLLATLQQRMDQSLVDEHEADLRQALEGLASAFDRLASPGELLEMMKLDDELFARAKGQPPSSRSGAEIMADIQALKRSVLQRRSAQ